MYRCPRCKSSELLLVDAHVDASLAANGELESRHTNLRAEAGSRVDCGVCGFYAAIEAFAAAPADDGCDEQSHTARPADELDGKGEK